MPTRVDKLAPPIDAKPLDFRILRNGTDIGRYAVDFTSRAPDLTATTELDIRMKFAFISVLRYEHRSTERWRNGALVDVRSRTESNGHVREVTSEPHPAGLKIFGPKRRITVVAPDMLTSNSIWHPAFVGKDEIIDMHSGSLLDITAEADGIERIGLKGGETPARRYRVYLPKFDKFQIQLRYDDRGRWIGGLAQSEADRILFKPV
ncbi:MAG: hypothetical protein EXQ88_02625 [Alphaproteobacteria bacterium]|nr:hypothetical protein [Alphaproteobacteria bacterium]